MNMGGESMDCSKVGKLLLELRKEKGMTQKNIADAMNISDKTISKWERGLGCPDVSLLNELSNILGVNIEKILLGDLDPNDADGGNMKRIKFYVCPNCGNVITGTGGGEMSCCGRKLEALIAKPENEEHKLTVEEMDGDYYITFEHEMSKAHYISFVAYVACDRVLMVKLYPEQSAAVRFPQMYGGKLYAYCNQHGLWRKEK
jgi:DNA-binding XRE family transcriptional regulator/desulfoferrodoxin (superoxide reductase-like protein)